MLVNVVKTLGPGLDAFLLDLDNLLTETTPKPSLAVSSYSALLKLGI
jgi:hypothetical protein